MNFVDFFDVCISIALLWVPNGNWTILVETFKEANRRIKRTFICRLVEIPKFQNLYFLKENHMRQRIAFWIESDLFICILFHYTNDMNWTHMCVHLCGKLNPTLSNWWYNILPFFLSYSTNANWYSITCTFIHLKLQIYLSYCENFLN